MKRTPIPRSTSGWFIIRPTTGAIIVFSGAYGKSISIGRFLRMIPSLAQKPSAELMEIWRREYASKGWTCQKVRLNG